MEEIDIIELLKRVKEGKAPKEIEVKDSTFEYNEKYTSLNNMYRSSDYIFNGIYLLNILNNFDTKIKILDKPILKELKEWSGATDVANKLNEVIRYLKSKE